MIKNSLKRYILFVLFCCCLLFMAIGQLSCHNSREQKIKELLEINRQSVQKLPKNTADEIGRMTDLIKKRHYKASDSTLMMLSDTVALLLRKQHAYSEIMNYIKKASPLITDVIIDEKIRRTTLIMLSTYECESNGDLGMFDRAIDRYFQLLQEANTHSLHEMQQLIYNNLGQIYNIQQRYAEALKMHKKSLEINKKYNHNFLYFNYNNIASCYRNLGQYEKAMEFRIMALHEIPDNQEEIAMHVKLNLVDDCTRMQEYSMATKNILAVKAYYEKSQNTKNLPITYQRYAAVLWKTGHVAEATAYYKKAYSMLKSCNYIDRQLIIASYIEFCHATGDKDTEIALLNYSLDLDNKSDLGITKRGMASRFYRDEMDKNDASTKYYKKVLKSYRICLVAILALMFIFVLLAFLNSRRGKKDLKKMINDREEMHTQLTKATMELQRVESLLQTTRNDLDEYQKFLVNATHKESIAELRKIRTKANLADSATMTNDSFVIANPTFFKKLLKEYPKLTTNDLKLCAMLRQGMTSKEIAAITGKEVRSVEVSRNRLRHKLNLTKEQDTVLFLMQF